MPRLAGAAAQDPPARAGVADLRHTAARRRRRRRTRQADDRRRHLLQPDQRPARGRHPSTRRCAPTTCARRACGATRQDWRARLGAEIRIGLAFRTLASRMTDRAIDCRRRARPRRRHRPDAAADRRLQLAPPVGARAAPSFAVPQDPPLLALAITRLHPVNDDRSSRTGDYARKQIYCPSRVVRWSHGSRFDLARRLVAPRRRRPPARLRLRRRDVRRDGPRTVSRGRRRRRRPRADRRVPGAARPPARACASM